MRTIKFRFWNKKKRKMSKILGIGCIWEYLVDEWGIFNWPDIETMQFTGLKDKNGKEIYEGDILHREYFSDWIVTYKAPSFVIYNICDPLRTFPIWSVDTDEREVIGNIYEQEATK